MQLGRIRTAAQEQNKNNCTLAVQPTGRLARRHGSRPRNPAMTRRDRADGCCRPFSHRPKVHCPTPTSFAASATVSPSLRRRARSCLGSGSPCSHRNSGLLARNVTRTPNTKKATGPRGLRTARLSGSDLPEVCGGRIAVLSVAVRECLLRRADPTFVAVIALRRRTTDWHQARTLAPHVSADIETRVLVWMPQAIGFVAWACRANPCSLASGTRPGGGPSRWRCSRSATS
jgi:hypothetical protein